MLSDKVESIRGGMQKLYKEYEHHDSTITSSSNVVGGDVLDDLDGYDSYQSKFERPRKRSRN